MQTWTHIHAPKHFKEKTLAQLFLLKISSCIYHRLQTVFYLHSTGYINTHTHTNPLNSYYLCDAIGDFFAKIKLRLIESGFLRLNRHNKKKKAHVWLPPSPPCLCAEYQPACSSTHLFSPRCSQTWPFFSVMSWDLLAFAATSLQCRWSPCSTPCTHCLTRSARSTASSRFVWVFPLFNVLCTYCKRCFVTVPVFLQVETIGDAYMVVAGAPEKTKYHAHNICDMALDMVRSIDHLKDPSNGNNIQIRVGG